MTATADGVKHFNNQAAGLLSTIVNETLALSSEDFRFLLNIGAVYVNNERQNNRHCDRQQQ